MFLICFFSCKIEIIQIAPKIINIISKAMNSPFMNDAVIVMAVVCQIVRVIIAVINQIKGIAFMAGHFKTIIRIRRSMKGTDASRGIRNCIIGRV